MRNRRSSLIQDDAGTLLKTGSIGGVTYAQNNSWLYVKVLVFRSTYQELIGKDSQMDQLFQMVEEALARISAQATMQVSDRNHVRMSSGGRNDAREELRHGLESLCRTAASMGLKQFFMPRGRGDRALVNVARTFVPLAEPLQKEFLANHLPEDFIDRTKGTDWI